MKSQKVIALLLSTALSISTCVPLGSITALGAETGTTAQAVEVQEEVSDSAESAESPEEEEASAAEETAAAEEQEAASQEIAAEETEVTENAEDTENVTAEVEDDNNESADETEAPVPAQEEEASEAADNTNSEEADTAASEETAVPAEEPVQNGNVENSTGITAPAQTETVETDAQNFLDEPVLSDFSNAVEIKAGDSYEINIKDEDEYILFRFVPEETAAYTFYSSAGYTSSPMGCLYSEDGSLIDSWYNNKDNNNFEVNRIYTEGETYYFKVGMSNVSRSYKVYLKKKDLYAERVGDLDRTVSPGEEITLEVRTASSSEISYGWVYGDDVLEEGTSSAYTFIPQHSGMYYCSILDEKGNNELVYFNIKIDNHLSALYIDANGNYYSGTTVYVSPNASAVLNVTVSADNMNGIYYVWYDNDDWIEGVDTPSYTVGPLTSDKLYFCNVYDQYGNCETVTFNVQVENHLDVYTIDESGKKVTSSTVYAAPNSSVDLNVSVDSDDMTGLVYKWYDSSNNAVEGAGTTSCTVGPVTKDERYYLRVHDQYGNNKSINFYIRVLDYLGAKTINVGDIVAVNVNQDAPYAMFKFTPTATVEYKLYSTSENMDTYVEVFNDSHEQIFSDNDSGESKNFSLTKVFNAGTAYYIRARAYLISSDISFMMHLEPREEVDIGSASVTGITDKTYNGEAQTQTPVVTLNGNTLTAGTDYTVSYKNNTNAGTATVTITGNGNYTGTQDASFKISPASISSASVSGLTARTYTGKALTHSPVVKSGSVTLKAGTDYTVSYSNNINAGKATIIFTGKGNYTGTRTSSFVIQKAAQSIAVKANTSSIAVGKTAAVSVTGNKGTKSYKSSNTDVATVSAAGTVTAKKVGTVTITATSAATANYNAASKAVTIKVVPAATSSIITENLATGIRLTWKSVAGATGYKVYRGSALVTTIKNGSTVTCTDVKANTNGAKYIFKIVPTASTGNGLAKTLTTYRVARPTVSSAKNTAAKKMTVNWKKNAKASGYQIQYSMNRKFAKGNKTVNITKAATVSKVIAGLAKGKTYYVRIRTFKKAGKAKYWSAWSTAKSVKVTK